MTMGEYHQRLDKAARTATGDNDGAWNTAFRAALDEQGLELVPETPELMAAGYYRAVYPYGSANGWPAETAVVPKGVRL